MVRATQHNASLPFYRNLCFGIGLGFIGSLMIMHVASMIFSIPAKPDSSRLLPDLPVLSVDEDQVSSPATTRPENRTSIFIGVLSDPHNARRRAHVRKYCFPMLREEARKRGLQVEMKFVLGRAVNEGHDRGREIQGSHADPDVVQLGRTMLVDASVNEDVLLVSLENQHVDIMENIISLFRHGLKAGPQLIAKLDDDNCGNVTGAVWDRWISLGRPQHYYFGINKWEGAENASKYGVDSGTAPYMSGPFYGMSYNLAQLIFEREYIRTSQHHIFSSSSEDATVGRLVQFVDMRYLKPGDYSVLFDDRLKHKDALKAPSTGW